MFPLIIALHGTFMCKMFLKFAFLGTNASDWSHFTGFWTASTLSVPLWKKSKQSKYHLYPYFAKSTHHRCTLYRSRYMYWRGSIQLSTFSLSLLVQIFQIHCRWPNELTELDWNDEWNFFEIFKISCPGIIVLIDAQKTYNTYRWPIIYPKWQKSSVTWWKQK